MHARTLNTITRVTLSVAVLSTILIGQFVPDRNGRHFAYLANAMARGSFSVNDLPPAYVDKVIANGDIFIPLSPMPAILLAPLNGIFGLAFHERWLGVVFSGFNVLVWFVIMKRLGIAPVVRKALLTLFFCGTIYLSALTMGMGWFLAHIIATTFLSLAILEVLSARRVWLLGTWLGLAFLTRSTTIFSLPFFVWVLEPSMAATKNVRRLAAIGLEMAAGLVVPFAFFAYYNYARFGGIFETGYGQAVVGNPELAAALKVGLFSVTHIPKNLYALLLAMPEAYPSLSASVLAFPYIAPSPWGMGIFFTTPAFVYAFAAGFRQNLVHAAWLAIGLVALPLITYYGVGWIQFGYRYALDFYPFLFLLTALGMAGRFDRRARILIVVSIIINVWGAWWQMIGFHTV